MNEDKFKPGTELYHSGSGEVMTYAYDAFEFVIRDGHPWAIKLALGYDDYSRVVEWPHIFARKVKDDHATD